MSDVYGKISCCNNITRIWHIIWQYHSTYSVLLKCFFSYRKSITENNILSITYNIYARGWRLKKYYTRVLRYCYRTPHTQWHQSGSNTYTIHFTVFYWIMNYTHCTNNKLIRLTVTVCADCIKKTKPPATIYYNITVSIRNIIQWYR